MPGQEDDRELEALRLVDGQHRDRVGVRVELGGGRVVARLDERGEVLRDEDGPVVGQERRLRADDLEEARDVLELLLGGRRVRADQPGEDAARAQEAVQELAGRSRVSRLRVAAQVRDEPMDRGPRLAGRGAGSPAAGRARRGPPRPIDCDGAPC